jgi:hypothetical protein
LSELAVKMYVELKGLKFFTDEGELMLNSSNFDFHTYIK